VEHPSIESEDDDDAVEEETDGVEENAYESDYEYQDDEETPGLVNTQFVSTTKTWRDPSKEAIKMSLRAERETTGGKRRLASDLYKIMMADTREQGFLLEPKSEDSMDVWVIKLFQFDKDSNLHKDMIILGIEHIELEMTFPNDYPFAPPFVRVVRPRFKRGTGFIFSGAICFELLTKDGWNPVCDIDSVIVSIRAHLVVGNGRLKDAADMPEKEREAILAKKGCARSDGDDDDDDGISSPPAKLSKSEEKESYTLEQAKAAHAGLSNIHEKHGWSNHWCKKG
jgi:ubiquitin-conjugating enzyme E2 Q